VENRKNKVRPYKPQEPSENIFIYGIRAVMEAIDAGKEIEKVMVQRDLNGDLVRQLIGRLKSLRIPFTQLPMETLNRVTKKNHQGIIGFMSAIQYHSLDNVVESVFSMGKEPFILILDRVTDVRNFGALARTAECAGVDALVIQSRGNALIGGDAMKTSAGALSILPVCREDNLKEAIRFLKQSGIRMVGCTEKADRLIYETDLSGPVAIIMGSEEDGISPEYLSLCDTICKIPMEGKIASLNVSVSAGVIIYESLRQRRSAGK
jgi:23S rRNA (guanosine2251-2'-O)-methyltransferase